MEDIVVEFVPMIGWKDHPDFGRVMVDHKQWIVYVSGRVSGRKIELGYVCQHPGAPFNGIVERNALPESVRVEVERQINEKLGGPRKFYWAPRVKEPEPEVSSLILPDSYYEGTDGD